MKVLHVNYSDYTGGAARAAYRIHSGLRKIGVDSHMLVLQKVTNSETVSAPLSTAQLLRSRIFRKLERKLCEYQQDGNPILHSLNLFSSGLARHIDAHNPDVVNLHWLGYNTLTISEIARIRQPVVWTLHDMWTFTGTAHYEQEEPASGWQQGYVGKRPEGFKGFDWDKIIFRHKKRAWSPMNLVTPSRWLAECAGKSALCHDYPRKVIHNGIDLSIYRPIDRRQARAALGLPLDCPLILFCALSSTADPRKGFHQLGAALQLIEVALMEKGCRIVVLGGEPGKEHQLGKLPTHSLGTVSEDADLALIYSAADVFVAPSLQDNLPNTMVESLACGTPCVAFSIGGFKDAIVTGSNGFLAEAFDVNELASGILAVLNSDSLPMRDACRESAQRLFADTDVAKAYLAHYEALVPSGT